MNSRDEEGVGTGIGDMDAHKQGKYGLYMRSLCFGAFLSFVVMVLQVHRGYSIFHCASDGCFAAAVFLFAGGVFRFVANRGLFDVPAFGIRWLFAIHHPKEGEREDFFSYREQKKQRMRPALPLLLCGVLYLGLSVVFLTLSCLRV